MLPGDLPQLRPGDPFTVAPEDLPSLVASPPPRQTLALAFQAPPLLHLLLPHLAPLHLLLPQLLLLQLLFPRRLPRIFLGSSCRRTWRTVGTPLPLRAPAPLAEPWEDVSDRPLKTRNPDFYYGNTHMECYHFCQQYEDHFKTAGAKGHKRVSFAACFLKDCILHR